MFGPSMDYAGGMTEVIRAYSAAGLFEAWPLRYISTYAGRDFSAKLRLRLWLSAVCSALIQLARRRVALVHVHSSTYGSFWRKSVLCALAFAFGVPYVIHLHGGRLAEFYQGGCNALAKAWVRAVLREAARVVVLSRHWRDEVRKIEPAARTTIIGNPVSVPISVVPLQRPARTVLFLAWLQRTKGVLDLVRAIPTVLRSVPKATFVIAGRGFHDGDETWIQEFRVLGPDGRPLDLEAAGERVAATVAAVHRGDAESDTLNRLVITAGLDRRQVAILRAYRKYRQRTDDALRSRLREAARTHVRKRYSTEAIIEDLGMLYRELGIRVEPVKPRGFSNAPESRAGVFF